MLLKLAHHHIRYFDKERSFNEHSYTTIALTWIRRHPIQVPTCHMMHPLQVEMKWNSLSRPKGGKKRNITHNFTP